MPFELEAMSLSVSASTESEGLRHFIAVLSGDSAVASAIADRAAYDAVQVTDKGARVQDELAAIAALDAIVAKARSAQGSGFGGIACEIPWFSHDVRTAGAEADRFLASAILPDFGTFDPGSPVMALLARRVFGAELSSRIAARLSRFFAGSGSDAEKSLAAMRETSSATIRDSRERLKSEVFELNLRNLGL